MPLKNRARLVASSPSTAKLFVDDLREIAALTRAENRSNSDLIRELVHEALRMRRLRAIGRDEGEEYVRRIHRDAIVEGVEPLRNSIADLRQLMEQSSANARSSGAKMNETLANLVAQLLQRAIVTERVVRVLMNIGMQRENVAPQEIKRHILGYDEAATRQTRELMMRILGESRASALNENV